ncbi:MAG: hypothetical protein OXG87_17660 [Gemmatimonadetes bacterium]|nr:hypothetical protein [Gemmatimonadota bacterium]
MKKYWEKRKRQKSILSAIEELDSGYGCYGADIVRKLGEETGAKNEFKMAKDLWGLKDKGLVDFRLTGSNDLDQVLRNIRVTPKGRKKWLLYRDDITSVSAIVAAIASVIGIVLTFLN